MGRVSRVFRPAARAVVRKNCLPSTRLVALLGRVAGSAAGAALSSADYEPTPVESFLIDEISEALLTCMRTTALPPLSWGSRDVFEVSMRDFGRRTLTSRLRYV